MSYQVKLEIFEGPFDLLLNLISRKEIDICDIPIAKITREYLAYLQHLRDVDLEVASEFLLVAATLLEIKASNLLPEEEDWEEISPTQARDILIARLLEYKKFKNVSLELAARAQAESRFYGREHLEERFTRILPDYLRGVTVADLTQAMQDILARKTTVFAEKPPPVVSIILNLEEKMDFVLGELDRRGSQTFASLISELEDKIEIVTVFIALLELYKRGLISLSQAVTFGDIEISLTSEK
ncbi:MAG: segregation/condensation protein A [Actinomycetota bacterium]